MAERSKAFDLRSNLDRGAGSNPAQTIFYSSAFFSEMNPSDKNKKSVHPSEISQIIMEGESLLKIDSPIEKEQPLRSFTNIPDSGLDGSFCIENKSYQFLPENDSFSTDLKKGPFDTEKSSSKAEPDRKMFKEITFASPPEREGKSKKKRRDVQLIDPDESLDIGTGTFRRKRRFLDDSLEDSSKFFKKDPSENTSFTVLPGFKTAKGTEVYLSEDAITKGRRSLDFLESLGKPCPPAKPRLFLPREKEIEDALKIYKKVKQEIFPLTRSEEEEFTLFELFRWSWIAMMTEIQEIRKRGGESEVSEIERIVLAEAKRRWKLNPKSVLRRVSEHDEHPAIYMKVLVVEEGKEYIKISDGVYSVTVRLDEPLQKISAKIRTGQILQVACSVLLQDHPISIYEANQKNMPVIELRYNGVKPCLSGPLGYQDTLGYIRSLSSIDMKGGEISCLMLNIVKCLETSCIININGAKTTIEEDRLESTLLSIEKTIESVCSTKQERMDALDKVKLQKYTRYEVQCEYAREKTRAILSVWVGPFAEDYLKVDKKYLFFMVAPPVRASYGDTILLTTTSRTVFKLI